MNIDKILEEFRQTAVIAGSFYEQEQIKKGDKFQKKLNKSK